MKLYAKGRWVFAVMALVILGGISISFSSFGQNSPGNVKNDPGVKAGLPPTFSESEKKALIARVKTTWRAQDGEHVAQIIGRVEKVAHFIPRGWDAGRSNDGNELVILSWARHPTDTEGDEYTIFWKISATGSVSLGPPYAKPMELGWQAFALSLIQSGVDDGDQNTNQQFLHDPSNLNFINTSQGKLGDLLKDGGCSIGDPVGVDYVPKVADDRPGDFWRIQLSVNCNVPGPRYFTRDGLIIFVKHGNSAWQPQSAFARLIASNPPGSWFASVTEN